MNGQRGWDSQSCNFHPKEIVIGVCSLCLRERLMVLASKQDYNKQRFGDSKNKKSSVKLLKIFAFTGLELRSWRCDHADDLENASTIHEDNGVASWEKKNKVLCKVSHQRDRSMPLSDHHTLTKHKTKTMIENPKPMTWHNRIGQFFQLIRPSIACHVATKGKGVKGKGWTRNLSYIINSQK